MAKLAQTLFKTLISAAALVVAGLLAVLSPLHVPPWMVPALAVLAYLAFRGGGYWLQKRREAFIKAYAFPPGLLAKLVRRHPQLGGQEVRQVEQALRQYFLIYLKSGRKFVSMPSQVVDDLWHEFILYTRNYQIFCKKAFGRFFHHTPAAVLSPRERRGNEGLRRVWWHACQEEGIDPRKPDRLPLLFALDGAFRIEDGFFYTPDCKALRGGGGQCGGDFCDSGIDGCTDGFGDGGGGDGDGDGGDGGGDGGDGGCGGGCGGGGD